MKTTYTMAIILTDNRDRQTTDVEYVEAESLDEAMSILDKENVEYDTAACISLNEDKLTDEDKETWKYLINK